MDFRRLSIFLEVVDRGSFTAAADALGCSQPAVSQAVRELESELETPLFFRIGRRIELTPAGSSLVAPARQLWRDLEVGRAAVRAVAGLENGRLDLACLPTLAVAPLAPLVGAFRERYPGVVVALAAPEDTDELVEFVRSGRCEVGIVERVPMSGLALVELGTQDFLVVLPPRSRRRATIALEDTAAMPIVVPPQGTSTRRLLEEAYAAAGATVSIGVETAQREALLPLILAGAGVGLLPRPLAELAGSLGCVIAEPTPPVRRAVALVYREGPLTPAAEAFVALAVERAEIEHASLKRGALLRRGPGRRRPPRQNRDEPRGLAGDRSGNHGDGPRAGANEPARNRSYDAVDERGRAADDHRVGMAKRRDLCDRTGGGAVSDDRLDEHAIVRAERSLEGTEELEVVAPAPRAQGQRVVAERVIGRGNVFPRPTDHAQPVGGYITAAHVEEHQPRTAAAGEAGGVARGPKRARRVVDRDDDAARPVAGTLAR
jgi:LysR family carnitine catabolism transcriptional activator